MAVSLGAYVFAIGKCFLSLIAIVIALLVTRCLLQVLSLITKNSYFFSNRHPSSYKAKLALWAAVLLKLMSVNAEKPLPDFIARALEAQMEAQMEAILEFFGIKPTKQETASVPEKRVKH